MSSTSMAAMFKKAKEEGFEFGEGLPNGEYDVAINTTNTGKTQGGDEKIGIHLKPVSGAPAVWMNQNLMPGNDKALAAFFRVMAGFGLGEDWFLAEPEPTLLQTAERIKQADPIRIRKGERKSKQGTVFPDIRILGKATGAPDVAELAPDASNDTPTPAADNGDTPPWAQ